MHHDIMELYSSTSSCVLPCWVWFIVFWDTYPYVNLQLLVWGILGFRWLWTYITIWLLLFLNIFRVDYF
jgi:hypothetical protein